MLIKNVCKFFVLGVLSVSIHTPVFAKLTSTSQENNYPDDWHTEAGCGKGQHGAFVLATIKDVRANEGNIRVQLYGDNPKDFLEKGKKLVRITEQTNYDEDLGQKICVALPREGQFALYVLHDRNGNLKTDFFTDGFGFSNNPKMGLAAPAYKKVAFNATDGVMKMDIVMNYVIGGDEEQIERRRRAKKRR